MTTKELKRIIKENDFEVVLYKQKLNKDIKDKLNVTDNVTDNRLKKIIELINKNNTISTIELSKFINVSKRTILRDIDKLKNQNIIRRIGNEKTGHWQIIKNE